MAPAPERPHRGPFVAALLLATAAAAAAVLVASATRAELDAFAVLESALASGVPWAVPRAARREGELYVVTGPNTHEPECRVVPVADLPG